MTIEVTAADLKRAINIGAGLSLARTPKEILKYMLVRSTGTKAAFFATDIETSVTVNIPASGVSMDFLLPVSNLFSTFNNKGDNILINANGRGVEIRCGKSKFDLQTPDPMEFPVRQSMEEDVCSLPVNLLQAGVGATIENCDKTETRYALNGVCFQKRDTLRIESTNGRMLGSYDTGVECKDINHVVPEKALRVVRNAIRGEVVNIGSSENAISFATEDCKVTATVCQGRFPNLEMVLAAKDSIEVATFKRGELMQICAQAKNMVDEESKGMNLTFSKGVLKVGTECKDKGKFYSEVEAISSAGDWQVMVDLEYLAQMIEPLSDQIEMGAGENRMLSVFNGNFRGMIAGMLRQ